MAKKKRTFEFTVRFPVQGLDQSKALEDQSETTSSDLQNVRPFDPSEHRARGGSRPGLGLYCTGAASADPVQCLVEYYGTELNASDPAGIENRSEGALAVVDGFVYKINFGGAKPFTMAKVDGQGSRLLADADTANIIWAAPVSNLVFFCDGTGSRYYYDAQENEMVAWALGEYDTDVDIERPFKYEDVFKSGSSSEDSEHGSETDELNEKQSVTLGGTPASGTFKLSFKGSATTDLAHDISAVNMKAALEAVDTIGSGNVDVTGTTPYVVEFKGDLANLNLPTLEADATGLKINGVIKIVTTGSPTGGDFTLKFKDVAGTVNTSGDIAYNAYPDDIQVELNESMSLIDTGDISCTGTQLTDGGNSILVEFRGQYAASDVKAATTVSKDSLFLGVAGMSGGSTPSITTSVEVTGKNPTVTVAVTQEGVSVSQSDDDRELVDDESDKGKFPQGLEKESICVTWGQRVVIAGIATDPQNYYISRFQDPFDFDWRHRQRDLHREANEEIRRYNTQVAEEISHFNAQLLDNINAYNSKVNAQITRANALGRSASRGYIVDDVTYGASTWVDKVPSNYFKDYNTLKKDVAAFEKDILPVRYGNIEDDTDRAVVGRYSPLGLVPDTITSLMPYNDDLLLIFCHSSIWELSGKPNTDAFKLRPVTKVIGGAEGKSWCLGPSGDIFFFSSRGGIYNLQLQAPPKRISSLKIDKFLSTVDVKNTYINMSWNETDQGFHIHITPHAGGETSHLFYDMRTQGWFPDKYDNNNHNPSQVLAINDRTAAQRDVVLGCLDGTLRYQTIGDTQTADQTDASNSTDIDSYVLLGPFGSANRERAMMIRGIRGTIGDQSKPVAYDILRGDSAVEASLSDPITSGVWTERRSFYDRRKVSGSSIYVKIKGDDPAVPWSFERATVMASLTGRAFERAR